MARICWFRRGSASGSKSLKNSLGSWGGGTRGTKLSGTLCNAGAASPAREVSTRGFLLGKLIGFPVIGEAGCKIGNLGAAPLVTEDGY